MPWELETITGLGGYTVEWAEAGNFYLSRLNRIYHSSDLVQPFREIGRIDAPSWRTSVSKARVGQRLLRFMVYNLIVLPDGDLFITFDKSVGLIRDGKYFELKGLARPCRVLRSGCAFDAKGNIYFGEYLANADRGPVRIYCWRRDMDQLEIVHTFPAGTIRHIHGLYADSFSDNIYCLTGDADAECSIIRSSDGFASIEIVGMGDESWRAVSLLFDKDHIYYGTDAEYRPNEIYSIDRATGYRKPIGTVSGPVFYSERIGSNLFFTITAENAPRQAENAAALWHVDGRGELTQVASFKKDKWDEQLFMFGTIHLPFRNHLDDRLHFSLVGVEGDNQTFCLRIRAS